MEDDDKRHIRRKYGRVSIVLLALVACRSQADRTVVEAGAEELGTDAAVAVPSPREATIYGEWERKTEPYRGMRMRLREGERAAVVTQSAVVDEAARNKAQLACQRSLWKPGDVLMTDVDGARATIVVRDWGLTTGVCRHRDAKAFARVSLAGDDTLAIAVTRGKTTVTQEWSRVRSP